MDWKRFVFGEFSWARLLRLPFIIYGTLLIIAYFFSYVLIFPYRQCSYTDSLENLSFLQSSNGARIAYTYDKAPQEDYLALYFHGNAEDLGHLYDTSDKLNKNGISALAIDYPGYGLSEGKMIPATL